MPLGDLLLGTNRLRREIAVQSLQLGKDIHRARAAGENLKRVTLARVTSPLSLGCIAVAGYAIGKWHQRNTRDEAPSTPPHTTVRHTAGALTGAALATLRNIGWQWIVPIAIEWVANKFESRREAPADSAAEFNSAS